MWAGLNRFDPRTAFVLGGVMIGMGCMNLVAVISRYTQVPVTLNYTCKHSSGTIYVAFRDPGQIQKIRDCPGDSGTVGAYALDSWSLVSYDHTWYKLVIIFHGSQDMARPRSAERSLGCGNRVT